tara:strand:+ start:1059 stop:1370 length:312 start_codon:yes stop_codon:yes gene_type:complete
MADDTPAKIIRVKKKLARIEDKLAKAAPGYDASAVVPSNQDKSGRYPRGGFTSKDGQRKFMSESSEPQKKRFEKLKSRYADTLKELDVFDLPRDAVIDHSLKK